MDLNPLIVDVSSDDDGAWDEHNDDNFGWLSELFDAVDNEKEESDDVVVIDAFSCSPAAQTNNHNKVIDTSKASSKDDRDDDCVVLDGDPENPVPVVNDTADGSDELLIVGETGELACRDFPHSRHVCVKFPFSSSPHEKYCDQCHCYVCDLLAPCSHWGTGASSTDHCHSNDKEEIWKLQRKNFRQGQRGELLAQKVPDTVLSLTPGTANTVPSQTLSESLNRHPGLLPPVSRSKKFYPCSSSTGFSVPNIISLRNQRSGLNLSRSRLPRHENSRSQPVPSTRYFVGRNRGGHVSPLGPQFSSPHTKFKRAGYADSSLTANRSAYGSSKNNNHVYVPQSLRSCNQVTAPSDSIHVRWQEFLANEDLELDTYQCASQPNLVSSFAGSQSSPVVPQPEVYSQPLPQQHGNQNSYPHINSAPIAANMIPPDFDFGWTNSMSQSQQHPVAEGSQVQSIQSMYEQLPVTEAQECPGISNPESPKYNLESWIHSLDHQLDPGAENNSMPSEVDFISLQHDPIDPSLLLYDLGSWNDLGHI